MMFPSLSSHSYGQGTVWVLGFKRAQTMWLQFRVDLILIVTIWTDDPKSGLEDSKTSCQVGIQALLAYLQWWGIHHVKQPNSLLGGSDFKRSFLHCFHCPKACTDHIYSISLQRSTDWQQPLGSNVLRQQQLLNEMKAALLCQVGTHLATSLVGEHLWSSWASRMVD